MTRTPSGSRLYTRSLWCDLSCKQSYQSLPTSIGIPYSLFHFLRSYHHAQLATTSARSLTESASMERVIIYRLGSLGDTVAALPCFHLIRRSFPDAERLVLTNVPVSKKAAPLETILREGGLVHGSIAYPLGLRDPVALVRLARNLRRQGADTLVYLADRRGLTTAWRDVAYFKLCGFRRIIGAPLTSDLQMNRIDGSGELERESHRLGRTLAELGTIDFDARAWWDLRWHHSHS